MALEQVAIRSAQIGSPLCTCTQAKQRAQRGQFCPKF